MLIKSVLDSASKDKVEEQWRKIFWISICAHPHENMCSYIYIPHIHAHENKKRQTNSNKIKVDSIWGLTPSLSSDWHMLLHIGTPVHTQKHAHACAHMHTHEHMHTYTRVEGVAALKGWHEQCEVLRKFSQRTWHMKQTTKMDIELIHHGDTLARALIK